jgi:hypothetical protein
MSGNVVTLGVWGLGRGLQVAASAPSARCRVAAVLDTDDFRQAAVKTYLRLGFRPWITHRSHLVRWTALGVDW